MLKLKQDERVRDYELTVLTPGDFTSTEQQKTLDTVAALIKKVGGEVNTTEDWGKRELAYTIQKQAKKYRQAVYTHLLISLPAKKVLILEKQLLLLVEVIRYLLVLADTTEPTKVTAVKQRERK